LLALVIGEFDYIQSQTKRGTLVRVISPLQKGEYGRYALDCGIRCLELYEDWFKIQ